jgi:acyl carrier protein
MTVEERVRRIIADQLEVPREQLQPGTRFVEDLRADSLALVELVLALEEGFRIKIPDEEGDAMRTVGDVIAFVRARAR